MKRKERYSKDRIEEAVISSKTIKEALEKLELRAAGGNYKVFHKYVKLYGIDTSHFESKKERVKNMLAKNMLRRIPTEEILVENSSYNRTNLKERLYKEDYKERKCEDCGQGEEWRGKKMSLILDHINGVHNDNRIENLQILCPNCAATLDTHCGKNNGNKFKLKKERENNGGVTDGQRDSNKDRRKVERPPYEMLKKEVEEIGYSATGKKYGVSDNTVRKWVRFYEKYEKI